MSNETLDTLPPSQSAPKYPWSEWTDLHPHSIHQGQDFATAPKSMRAILSGKACKLGLKVRITGHEDLLTFQFYDPEDDRFAGEFAYHPYGRGSGRPAKYPWDEWTDGNVHSVSADEMPLGAAFGAMQSHKDRRGLRLRTYTGFSDENGTQVLMFQFAGEQDDERFQARRDAAMDRYRRRKA